MYVLYQIKYYSGAFRVLQDLHSSLWKLRIFHNFQRANHETVMSNAMTILLVRMHIKRRRAKIFRIPFFFVALSSSIRGSGNRRSSCEERRSATVNNAHAYSAIVTCSVVTWISGRVNV